MSDERQYEVKTRERDAGGWMYQLFVIGADDPLAWESDGKSYRTQQDAERAGHLAVAAKLWRDRR
jgi:hypothetical protein